MGDPTTDILIDGDLSGRAEMTAREPGVLAGIEVAAAVFRRLDPSLEVEIVTEDGSRVARRPARGRHRLRGIYA